jgi:hypothetical protein
MNYREGSCGCAGRDEIKEKLEIHHGERYATETAGATATAWCVEHKKSP